MKNEAFLPKKAFAGSKKHNLGTKGQARGEPGRSQKAPLTGLMVGESPKDSNNFSIDDIKELENIKDLDDLKNQAVALISKPSKKPMDPRKVQWFKTHISSIDSPRKIVKLMYDLLLSGEGNKVIGSRFSTKSNSYRQTFGESVIIGPDESGDWTNPQVQILGGGGSYTLDRLYKKAQGEAAEIKDLIDAGEHKKAAFYLKQFKNTVDTIVAAKDELSKRHFGESKQRLDPKCWKGYRKQGTKMKDGVRVNNCVKVKEEWEIELDEMIRLLKK